MVCCKSEWEWGWVVDITTDNGEGHCRLWKYNNEDCYWISDLYVQPSSRKKGFATSLLNTCDFIANPVKYVIKVVAKEDWQKKLYWNRGYKIVDIKL